MIFLIDFDGTLAIEDTVDGLLGRFAEPAWQELEADWLAGKISAEECMRGQLQRVRAERPALEKFFRAIELDASFREFWHYARKFAHFAIVSDGLDYAIHTALRRNGLGALPVFANRLRFLPPDRLQLDFPYRDPGCKAGNGVCKCAVARRMAARYGGPVALVGDGKSDACLAMEANIVFAKDSLARHCVARSIRHIPFAHFSDVFSVVRGWTGRRPRLSEEAPKEGSIHVSPSFVT